MRLVKYEYIRATKSYIVDIDEKYCDALIKHLKSRSQLEFDESKITPNYVLACFEDDVAAADIYQVMGEEKGWNDTPYPIFLTGIIHDYVDDDLCDSYHDTVDIEWLDSDTVVEETVTIDGCTRIVETSTWKYLEEHK